MVVPEPRRQARNPAAPISSELAPSAKPSSVDAMPATLVRLLILAALVGALLVGYRMFWRADEAALVVYCAHDAEFADLVFAEFRRRSGLQVSVRYDSEATKSLGLVERLIAEDGHGPCDVFWNNEQLGTLDLARRGLLAPYRGSGWRRMAAPWRDADGAWSACAARMRVMMVDTRRLPATTAAVRERLAGDLSRVAIAKPLFGTTLTHYSTWWAVLGAEPLQAWHHDSRARGLHEVDGNGMVKALIAAGGCDLGFTDSDDFYAARDAGAAVAMVPARIADIAPGSSENVLLIPNTVAIVRGAGHRAAAEQLVDFLLSQEGELVLARSPSRQIPLGPVADGLLPPEVRALRAAAADWTPPPGLAVARNACLAWLKGAQP